MFQLAVASSICGLPPCGLTTHTQRQALQKLKQKFLSMSLRQALRESKEAAKREAAEAERARLGIVDAPAPPPVVKKKAAPKKKAPAAGKNKRKASAGGKKPATKKAKVATKKKTATKKKVAASKKKGGAAAKKKKKKKKRKGGTSGWIEFCRNQRDAVVAETPDLAFGDVTKALSVKWKVVSDEDKAEWNAKAKAINDARPPAPESSSSSSEEEDEEASSSDEESSSKKKKKKKKKTSSTAATKGKKLLKKKADVKAARAKLAQKAKQKQEEKKLAAQLQGAQKNSKMRAMYSSKLASLKKRNADKEDSDEDSDEDDDSEDDSEEDSDDDSDEDSDDSDEDDSDEDSDDSDEDSDDSDDSDEDSDDSDDSDDGSSKKKKSSSALLKKKSSRKPTAAAKRQAAEAAAAEAAAAEAAAAEEEANESDLEEPVAYDDGYDANFFGDAKDHAWLMSLTDFDRENELSERADKREQGEEEYRLRQRLYLKKLKKRNDARKARLALLKKSKKAPRMTRADRERERSEKEEERKKRVSELRRGDKGARATLASDSDSESSSDSDDDSDYGSDSGRARRRAADKKRRAARGGSSSSSDDDSDEDSDGDVRMGDGGGRGGRGEGEEVEKVTLATMRRAQMKREDICLNQTETHFKTMYKGCFALLDNSRGTKKSKIIVRIHDWGKEYKRVYDLGWKDPNQPQVKTKLIAKLESAGSIHDMPLDKISNMTFTQLHLDAYNRLRAKNSLRYTTEKEVQKVLGKKKRTKELADSEEGRKLYSKDKRWTHLPNLPKDKMDAHFQLADAQKNGDEMQQMFFEQVLKRIEQKEKQVMQMIKNQQIRQTIHEVNVRNKGLSVARMEIAALEAREKAKTEIMDKEYYLHSTRPSRPGILWRMKKGDGDDVVEMTEEEKSTAKAKAQAAAAAAAAVVAGTAPTAPSAKFNHEQNAAKALFQVRS